MTAYNPFKDVDFYKIITPNQQRTIEANFSNDMDTIRFAKIASDKRIAAKGGNPKDYK